MVMSAKRFEHAVVVGSGIAGLVTSRVLADHFERVTLLERDPAPSGADARSGVPQGRHFHGLLPGGLLILVELFPLRAGAPRRGLAAAGPDEFYCQGMSAACRQAMALRRNLEQCGDGLDGLWRAFLPAAFQETRAPWLFAALADFKDSRCTGDFPAEEGELINLLAYVVAQAAAGDQDALWAAMAIQALVAPLESLRQPPWPERLAAVGGA
jgi:glycine/D-amino acid oxidase-like deaminating enzyme